MTDLLVPDLAEPIVAYKGFVHQPGSSPLLCPIYGSPWNPDGPTVARCERRVVIGRGPCGDCPCPPGTPRWEHAGAGCGLYGHRDIEALARHLACGVAVWHTTAVRVLLWGRVFEYELGYRAEYGQVDAVLAFDGAIVNGAVAERYGVPVVSAGMTATEATALYEDQRRLNRNEDRRMARAEAKP